MPPSAPMDAASVGVASPKRIEPSTAKIRKASGTKDVTIITKSFPNGTSGTSSFVGFGATEGWRIDRPTM
jgi:hypothetical protein